MDNDVLDVGLGDLEDAALHVFSKVDAGATIARGRRGGGGGLLGYVGDGSDEAAPEPEEVVDGVGEPLPLLEAPDGEGGGQITPFVEAFGSHQLAELVVGLETPQQTAEFVVVLVVVQAWVGGLSGWFEGMGGRGGRVVWEWVGG